MQRRITSLGVALVLATLVTVPASGQFSHFTTRDGLGNDIIRGFGFYDGEILIATAYGGFVQFNGHRVKAWNTGNGLPVETENSVSGFYRAADGSFLIPCTGGLVHWDGVDSFTLETLASNPQSQRRLHLTGVIETPDGTLWISTNQGLARKTNGNWAWDSGIPVETTANILITRDGAVWVGSQFSGLFRFNGSTWENFGGGNGFSASWISGLFEDSQGNLWVGTRNGAVRYDGTNWRTFTSADGLADDNVLAITEDLNGDLWFAISSFGVTRWDGETWASFGVADGLIHETVGKLFVDPWGGLWIGTGRGVSRFDGSGWSHFTDADGLSGSRTYAIAEDTAGNLWVGGLHGASRWDGSAWQAQSIVPIPPGSNAEAVLDVDRDSSGRMWFSTNNGIAILDGGTWTYVRAADGLADNVVWDAFEDSKGRMWVGVTGGVSRLDAQGWTHDSPATGLPDGWQYTDIAEDPSGAIWVAATWRVLRWTDEAGWETVDFPEDCNFPPCGADALEVGPNGDVWIAGGQGTGLYRYDGAAWNRITTADGLLTDRINDLIFDDSGALWMSSSNGLSRMKDGVIGSYASDSSGLPVNDLAALYQDSNGTLWIAGSGLTRHFMDRLDPISVPVTVPPPASASRLQTATWVAGFKETAGTRYQTSFDGGVWSEPTTLRVWSQDGLADGSHDLRIRSIDAIGNVESNPLRVEFTVDATPPLPIVSSPGFSAAVAGTAQIRGTASDPRFVSYGVDVRALGTSNWTPLEQATEPVIDDVLAVWDTRAFAEGEYEIRVQLLDDVGLIGTTVTQAIVDNRAPFANVTSPVRITPQGGEVFSTNAEARLYFPPGAFRVETVVRIEPPSAGEVPDQLPDGASRVWEGMTISWDGNDPVKTATLDLHKLGVDGTPAVYALRSAGTWEFLGGTWDAATGSITLPVTKSGTHALFTGGSGNTVLPPGLSAVNLTPRVLNQTSPPLTIGFSLDRPGPLTVRVFNRAGRLVRSVVHGVPYTAGVHAVRWDGRNESGETVGNGLYIVAIEALGQKQNKTVSVVR